MLGAGIVLASNIKTSNQTRRPATTDWYENFDSYAAGSYLGGQGGWAPWDNTAAANGKVSNAQSHSPSNSYDSKWNVSVAQDMVHQYSGYTMGRWIYTAWLYVPATETGNQMFILMNTYTPGTAHNSPDWSLQLFFGAQTGHIWDSNAVSYNVSINLSKWVKIVVDINLTADKFNVYIDGKLFEAATSWKNHVATGGAQNLACVDLYSGDTTTTTVYWDDLSLVEDVPPVPLSCDADGPYEAYINVPIQFNGTAAGGTPPYTWAWQFGDGQVSPDQNPTHAYGEVEDYTATLTVTDSAKATVTDNATVTINKIPLSIIGCKGGKGINATIQNTGSDINITDIHWTITLTGGFILKGKSNAGNFTLLGPGQKGYATDAPMGIGRVTIQVTAGAEAKTYHGFVLLKFVLNVK